MKFKVGGKVLDASHMRVREVCEAEKALGIDMSETGVGGKTAVAIFIARRRAEPEKPVVLLADEVMAADMETFEEADEEIPPTSTPTEPGDGNSDDGAKGGSESRSGLARESLPTSGLRPSVPSE